MRKRGLSSVVTTIILILLILVAIAAVWAVVNNLIVKGSADVSLRKLTVDVDLSSVIIDYATGIATLKISRNVGEGEAIGVKIIVSDGKNTEVITKYIENFDEYESRTFEINLSAEASSMRLVDIEKITIVPIIILESGKEVLGQEDTGIKNINKGLSISDNEGPEENDTSGGECTDLDLSDCEPAGWTGTISCLNNNVVQDYQIVSCFYGLCLYNLQEDKVKETCSTGYACTESGQCVEIPQTCTSDPECGTDGHVGNLKCINITTVGRDYQNFSCISQLCELNTITLPIEYCIGEQVCGAQPGGSAACFTPLECSSNADCDPGEVCDGGSCVIEMELNSGTINSIWPFFIGEYFDSSGLPTIEEDYTGYYIIFPFSDENRCMKITEHVYPNKTGAYAYVRLNESITNISTGDLYEVWETGNACL
jgi:flagellin-like protein